MRRYFSFVSPFVARWILKPESEKIDPCEKDANVYAFSRVIFPCDPISDLSKQKKKASIFPWLFFFARFMRDCAHMLLLIREKRGNISPSAFPPCCVQKIGPLCQIECFVVFFVFRSYFLSLPLFLSPSFLLFSSVKMVTQHHAIPHLPSFSLGPRHS